MCTGGSQKRIDGPHSVKYSVVFYFVSLLVSASWFILGKGHSYIHTSLNFVMWYFGFVQFCIYIIIKQFINIMYERKESMGSN